MNKVNSAIRVPCKLEGNFFNYWLTFLTPIHKLTPSVINIAAEILKHRYLLSKSISDDTILDNYLLTNEEIRNKIIETCKISLSNYHVGIGKLKKAGFFIDSRINPKFIPKLGNNQDQYNFLLIFDMEAKNG